MSNPSSNEKLFGKYNELVLLLLGFLLTSVVGGLIGERFQRRSWEHEHLVQQCEAEQDRRAKRFEAISDLMDKRLLRMRKLAWKLEQAHQLSDVKQERKENIEARDEWATQLNSNIDFVRNNLGTEAGDTLQNTIADGFRNIHEKFNDLFKTGKLDKKAAEAIEEDINNFNPTVYFFDVKARDMIAGQLPKCNTMP
jgi:hypothetical protein